MDHIVYLDAKSNEIDNLIKGNKSMIIRGASGRKVPYGMVKEGDILYFLNNNTEGVIKAKGEVISVYDSEKLSVEESFETIIRNQDKLQLPDKIFEEIAGKQYLVLVGLDNVQEINPARLDKDSFSNVDDWLPVGKIDNFIQISSESV